MRVNEAESASGADCCLRVRLERGARVRVVSDRCCTGSAKPGPKASDGGLGRASVTAKRSIRM